MKYGVLSSHFLRIAAKRLSKVETDPGSSNQHEFNGSGALRDVLGDVSFRDVPANFVLLVDEDEAVSEVAHVSWYDSRENNPKRSAEWRLYYTKNSVMDEANEGDLLVIGVRPDNSLMFIIARGQDIEHELAFLFGIGEQDTGTAYRISDFQNGSDREIELHNVWMLEALGINIGAPHFLQFESILADFGQNFPKPNELCQLARDHAGAPDALEDPDLAFIERITFEEALFKHCERREIASWIKEDFLKDGVEEPDPDALADFSLSIMQRRRSRAGLAVENHIEAILQEHQVDFVRNARTENNSSPDFLFPSSDAYHDDSFDSSLLCMLGAKRTVKDRWRQVLTEADRIRHKHLFTMQRKISEAQTDEMVKHDLTLVIPSSLHGEFTPAQLKSIKSFREFIDEVKRRQRG